MSEIDGIIKRLEGNNQDVSKLISYCRLLKAQLDSERLKSQPVVCSLIGKRPDYLHEGRILRAFAKGKDPGINYYCEGCISFFDNICDPESEDSLKHLSPEYLACVGEPAE